MPFVAASAAVHGALTGMPQNARVAAVLPAAVYLRLTDGQLVALLARDAVRVPIGLVAAVARPGAVGEGDPAVVGGGELRLAALRYRPSRYWDPRAPRLGARLRTAAARGRAAALPTDVAGLTASRAGVGAVHELIGLGPGLTPAGDDVLAGTLVTLAALGHEPQREALAAAVIEALARTTPISAALLSAACRGLAVPEVNAVLRAVAGLGDLDAALARLLRVGATSGAALAVGMRVALLGDGDVARERSAA